MYRTYYRPYAVSRKPRVQEPTRTYSAEQVWGAASCANRINDGYYKDGDWLREEGLEPVRTKEPNRDIMRRALDTDGMVTDADIQHGMAARAYLSQSITMKGLRGHPLSDFDRTVGAACEQNEFTNLDRLHMAVIASQINGYEKSRRLEQAMERVDRDAPSLGVVGDKVTAEVEVVKSVHSFQYGCTFITAITSANQAVFFSYRKGVPVGTTLRIRGTIKALRPDATQLNRVKVLS